MALTQVTGDGLAASGLPTGAVLQVKSVTMTGVQSFAGTAFTAITDGTNALSISITPTASSSKFLLCLNINASADNGGSRFRFRFLRDSTVVGNSDTQGSRTPMATATQGSDSNAIDLQTTQMFLDSPATTSAITYSVKGQVESSSSNLHINRSGGNANSTTVYTAASSLTVMEIAG